MTDFERKVIREVIRIPLGETRTYKWIAKKIGSPKAARAVGNVLKKNSYPIFIPCHRVVKSNNKLGGYSLGEDIKKELINIEKRIRNVLK